jgi:methionine-rich copper-binding protein CopC
VQKLVALPAVVAPSESTNVSYTLTSAATVTAQLVLPTGAVFSTLLTAQKPAGVQTLAFTPPPGLPNGSYAIAINAVSGAQTATASIPITVDDLLTGFAVTGRTASFTFTRPPAAATFQVLQGKRVVDTPAVVSLAAGTYTLAWNGLLADGSRAPDGTYTLALSIVDDVTAFTRTGSVTIDTTPPKVTVLSYSNLRFRVSEPATLVLYVGVKRYARILKQPATTQFWLKTKVFAYRLVATDAAGNATTVRYRR